MSPTHIFGSKADDVIYRPRPAAYAVIKGLAGEVAVVKASGGYFLPGGGANSGETAVHTIKREIREELARDVRILNKIGEAVQYFRAENQYYRLEASFYTAEFVGEAGTGGEHQLYWLPVAAQADSFYHQCHAWAVAQV